MLQPRFDLRALEDRQVLDGVLRLHHCAAEVTADLLCHFAEVDCRRLYVGEGCQSLFAYAVERVGCTEDEASRRIHAARAGAKFPVVFELVASGEVTLTAVSKLAPHLTSANHREVLAEAKGKTLREIEVMVARLAPKPDVAPRLARLPEKAVVAAASVLPTPTEPPARSTFAATPFSLTAPATAIATTTASVTSPSLSGPTLTAPAPVAPPGRSRVAPLSPERWALQVTIGTAAQQALRQAQDLSRHSDPRINEATIVERALIEYAQRLEARKFGKLLPRKPGPASPAKTKQSSRRDAPPAATTGTATLPSPARTEPGTLSANNEPAPLSAMTEPGTLPAASERAPLSATTEPGTLPAASERVPLTATTEPSALPTTSARATKPATTEPRALPPAQKLGARASAAPATDTQLHVAKHVAQPCGRRPTRAMKRKVYERDGGRCTYVSPDGHRCSARSRLQFHHIEAWALGGETTIELITLRCRVHNFHQAVRDFGAEFMAEAIHRRRTRGQRR